MGIPTFSENKVYSSKEPLEGDRQVTRVSTMMTKGGRLYNLIHWTSLNRHESGVSSPEIFQKWITGKYSDGFPPRKPKPK